MLPFKLHEHRIGAAAALAAFVSWGVMPGYYKLVAGVAPLEIIAHRILWAFPVLLFFLLLRDGRAFWKRMRLPLRQIGWLMLSSSLVAFNWLIFVWAVVHDQVLATSLGYFINPLVSVAIGMILLGERLNRWQGVAIGVAIVAVAVQSLGVAGLPLVSLALAFSFGFYGYFRKTVNVGSAPGLFVETLMLLPLALIFVGWEFSAGQASAYADPWLLFLLVMTGPATSGALLMFAFAARRLRLSSMGMFQYIAPSMHFMLAVWAFGEPIDTLQLLSFGLIWLSLAIYSYDSIKRRPKATVLADGGIASATKR